MDKDVHIKEIRDTGHVRSRNNLELYDKWLTVYEWLKCFSKYTEYISMMNKGEYFSSVQ